MPSPGCARSRPCTSSACRPGAGGSALPVVALGAEAVVQKSSSASMRARPNPGLPLTLPGVNCSTATGGGRPESSGRSSGAGAGRGCRCTHTSRPSHSASFQTSSKTAGPNRPATVSAVHRCPSNFGRHRLEDVEAHQLGRLLLRVGRRGCPRRRAPRPPTPADDRGGDHQQRLATVRVGAPHLLEDVVALAALQAGVDLVEVEEPVGVEAPDRPWPRSAAPRWAGCPRA
jgi:hypothetical protein